MQHSPEERDLVFKVYNQLEAKVKEQIDNLLVHVINENLEIIKQCETPIERILAVPLNDIANNLHWHQKHVIEASVLPQKTIGCNNKTYRIDFVLQVLLDNDHTLHFAVECDGHNFHEKTKEQARRDKARERALQNQKFTIIRFTGSEIYKDPTQCCEEVEEIISTKIHELYSMIDK